MSYLFNRDTCAAWLRANRHLAPRLQQHQGQLHVPALTIFELEVWLSRATTPSALLYRYGLFLRDVQVVSLDDAIAHRAAQLNGAMRRLKAPLTTANLFVAATALERGLTLVTHRTQAFANVPGLSQVDWLVP
jgi:predicted nucleic acid-binding protein